MLDQIPVTHCTTVFFPHAIISLSKGQGQSFAKRQTMWDTLFMSIGSIGRDEKLASYLLRLVMSFLFNFTIGIFGAVVAFIFNLFSLIQSFRANIFSGAVFFILSSIAAISFAMTW